MRSKFTDFFSLKNPYFDPLVSVQFFCILKLIMRTASSYAALMLTLHPFLFCYQEFWVWWAASSLWGRQSRAPKPSTQHTLGPSTSPSSAPSSFSSLPSSSFSAGKQSRSRGGCGSLRRTSRRSQFDDSHTCGPGKVRPRPRAHAGRLVLPCHVTSRHFRQQLRRRHPTATTDRRRRHQPKTEAGRSSLLLKKCASEILGVSVDLSLGAR